MNRKIKYKIGLACMLLAFMFNRANAQQVNIIPQFRGGSLVHVDQFFQFVLVNNSPSDVSGSLLIDLKTKAGEALMQIESAPVLLKQGDLKRGNNLQWPSAMQLSSNPIAGAFQERGQLPYGEFIICYSFSNKEQAQLLGEYCSEFSVQITGQPELQSPRDRDVISHAQPVLQWRGPLSLAGQDLRYHLLLVALEPGQSAVEGINRNVPLLNKLNLTKNFLTYPLDAPALKKKVDYAWQITAFLGQVEIGKTDIWTFSLGEKGRLVKASADEDFTYPLLDNRIKGAYYIADEMLCFAYQNREFHQELQYKIYDLSAPDMEIANLPVVDLIPGWNKVSIAGADMSGLVSGKLYILEIENDMAEHQYLKFKYISE